MRSAIEVFLQKKSKDNYITLQKELECIKTFGITLRELEEQALLLGITPLRYKRNQITIDSQKQLQLLRSHVAIIGCGGLGGHIAEILARVGVGKLSLFDYDIFEEHNLNRQNFSNIDSLGKQKVLVVAEEIKKINPAIEVIAQQIKFSPQNDYNLISEANAIVDALDNPETKLELSFVCKNYKKPFIHGAIAGMNGQFCTSTTLENFYKDGSSGAETIIGNPAFSVTFAASIQSAEVIKTLLGIGETLTKQFLSTNLLDNEFIKL